MRRTTQSTLVFTLGASLLGACKAETTPNAPDPTPPPPTSVSIESVAPAAEGGTFWSPLDATPSPEGARVYFTATVEEGPAVLAVDAAGGAPEVLYAGEALAAPFGVVTSLDGDTLYVADSAVQAPSSELDSVEEGPIGGILSLAATGGDPSMLPGTEGLAPKSLHLSEVDGQEMLHFTGTDPNTGEAGVYRVPTAGGGVETVASGSPLSQPSGVIIASDGKVYVADSSATEDGQAALLVIDNGQVSVLAESLRLGYPAGITLDVAGTTLLASGLADDADTSVVHAVDLSTRDRAQISDGIGHNTESGGVHRAHDADVFAWANSDGDALFPGGTVYILKASPVLGQ